MFKFTTTVNIREKPSTYADIVYKKYRGDIVKPYDFKENEDRIWGLFYDDDVTLYFCAKDTNGEMYIQEVNESTNSSEVRILQKESKYEPVRKEGCCFCCACYLGGLNNINEVDNCFQWASTTPIEPGRQTNKVRSDSYVNMDKYKLAEEIAQRYGREMRSGTIVYGKNHFYVVDNYGNEIFNSAGRLQGH